MNFSDTATWFDACRPFARENARRLGWFFCYFDANDFDFGSETYTIIYKVFPLTTLLVFLDVFTCYQKGNKPRVNLTITSYGIAAFSLFLNVIGKGSFVSLGCWIHTNLAIVQLDARSPWTWMLAVVAMDLSIYFVHRAEHEFNILWASHQIHHVHDQVNLAIGGRLSIFDIIFYVLPALVWSVVIPFEVMIVALTSSTLYTFLNHRNFAMSYGPLDYILVSPTAHHIHHAMNRSCIDVNFGNVFIVWDKMFGTFQPTEEKLFFGLTTPIESFDFLTLSFRHYVQMLTKLTKYASIADRLKLFFYGPGWEPGKPRLGLLSDIPLIDPLTPPPIHDPQIEFTLKAYVGIHSLLTLYILLVTTHMGDLMETVTSESLFGVLFFLVTLTAFGMIFDDNKLAPICECVRCLVTAAFVRQALMPNLHLLPAGLPADLNRQIFDMIAGFNTLCPTFWLVRSATTFPFGWSNTKTDREPKPQPMEQPLYEVAFWACLTGLMALTVVVVHASVEQACGYSLHWSRSDANATN